MSSIIESLRAIYPKLQNGDQQTLLATVEQVKALEAEFARLGDALAAAALPEAAASVTAKIVNPKTQIEFLFTARAGAPAGVVLGLIEMMPIYENALTESGYIAFDAYVDRRRAERETAPHPPPHTNGKQAGLPPRAQAQPAPTAPAAELSFQAGELVATMTGGKTYWKVKGGKFGKFGVTVWPEVLEAAGFDVSQLDPTAAYQLNDYTAVYVEKDSKPEKVIELRPNH